MPVTHAIRSFTVLIAGFSHPLFLAFLPFWNDVLVDPGAEDDLKRRPGTEMLLRKPGILAAVRAPKLESSEVLPSRDVRGGSQNGLEELPGAVE